MLGGEAAVAQVIRNRGESVRLFPKGGSSVDASGIVSMSNDEVDSDVVAEGFSPTLYAPIMSLTLAADDARGMKVGDRVEMRGKEFTARHVHLRLSTINIELEQ